MEEDIFLIIIIVVCFIGFLRLLQLFYIIFTGYKSKLEYVDDSYTNREYEAERIGETYVSGGYVTVTYLKVKYKTKTGLYLYKTIRENEFSNNLEPKNIIVYPHNDKKFIFVNKISTWLYPIICTLGMIFFLIIFLTSVQ